MAATALHDIRALGNLIGDVRATLRAVRAGPGDREGLACTLDHLAASASATAFSIGAGAVSRVLREAEARAEEAAGHPRRVPRPRREGRAGLRCVPGEGKTRALGTVAAMALLVLLVPHHAVRAAGASPAVAVASRPWRVPLSADRPKSAARARRRAVPGRDRP